MIIRNLFYKTIFWVNDFLGRLISTSGKIMLWTFPYFAFKIIQPVIISLLKRVYKNHILIEKFYIGNYMRANNDR